MAESFMKTLRRVEVDANAGVVTFIEIAYIHQRLHSALTYLSPVEVGSDQSRAAAQQPGTVMQPSCP